MMNFFKRYNKLLKEGVTNKKRFLRRVIGWMTKFKILMGK